MLCGRYLVIYTMPPYLVQCRAIQRHGDMLFAGDEFQEVVLRYYAHITHQKGAWIPEEDGILLAQKELACIDLCVITAPLAFNHCECLRIPLQLMKRICCIGDALSLCIARKHIP